jgi:2-polyprenyl-3-methyl-5-hydroxy-6-metoxy-1,4-benzoquinol methylase
MLEGGVRRGFDALGVVVGEGPLLAYLAMLAPRLAELRRVLKPEGSLYLHCDPSVSHYLRVLLDTLFGPESFRNEIVWHYGGRGAKAVARQFPRNHDVLLFYSRGAGRQRFTHQHVRRALTPEAARARGFRRDAEGRWFKTAPRGDYTDASLARLEAEGRLHRTRSGGVRVKYFLEPDGDGAVEARLVGDTWLDIPDAMHLGREKTGYPTQKPEALLERILRASSREGDLVLDPFCGSGTTLVVAARLGRRWIGIDSSAAAVEVVRARLSAAGPSSRTITLDSTY